MQSGATLQMLTAYHPQTDGQMKIVNKDIEHYLRGMVHNNPRKWVEGLLWVESWYNTTFHSSLGTSLFNAVYGREPPKLIAYQLRTPPITAKDMELN